MHNWTAGFKLNFIFAMYPKKIASPLPHRLISNKMDSQQQKYLHCVFVKCQKDHSIA